MSAHPLETVIKYWEVGKLTQEQVIGQILLLLLGLQQQIYELERRGAEGGVSPQDTIKGGERGDL